MFKDSTIEVYNFTVANCLNYFVGPSSVLVHNDSDVSNAKIQIAFMCGTWNGLVDIVKSVPDLVKSIPDLIQLLADVWNGKISTQVKTGYQSLLISKVEGCNDNDIPCKVWAMMKHGFQTAIAGKDACDGANFSGQIIGPLVVLALPIPVKPIPGAGAVKVAINAIAKVVNTLKWCDNAGDVFSYLGKSIKFIKSTVNAKILNVEIDFGGLYKIKSKDNGKFSIEGNTAEFDSAEDAFNDALKQLDIDFNFDCFKNMSGIYKAKFKKIYDDLPTVANKDALKNAISNVNNGYLDDLIELADKTKKGDKDGLTKCITEFGCFVAGTPVRTKLGLQAIETLHEGDSLWAYNNTYKRVEQQRITAKSVHTVQELQRLTLSNDEVILTTPNHKFFTHSTYIDAEFLHIGDTLLALSMV